MDRNDALDFIVRHGVFMIAPDKAEEVARAFGVTLDTIGVEPTTADVLASAPLYRRDAGSVRIKAGHAHDRAVLTFQLAATLALHFGLYGSLDHALASPYHKAQSECRYIACRGAIRLAHHFGGPDAVRALRERNPWMEVRLFREKLYTGTGIILRN